MDSVKTPSAQPNRDRVSLKAQGEQLASSHDPVLLARELRHLAVVIASP